MALSSERIGTLLTDLHAAVRVALATPQPAGNRPLRPLASSFAVEEFLPDVSEVFDDYGETASVPTPLWPWLSALALISFFFDIAIRRAPWFWRRFAGGRWGSFDGNTS